MQPRQHIVCQMKYYTRPKSYKLDVSKWTEEMCVCVCCGMYQLRGNRILDAFRIARVTYLESQLDANKLLLMFSGFELSSAFVDGEHPWFRRVVFTKENPARKCLPIKK